MQVLEVEGETDIEEAVNRRKCSERRSMFVIDNLYDIRGLVVRYKSRGLQHAESRFLCKAGSQPVQGRRGPE